MGWFSVAPTVVLTLLLTIGVGSVLNVTIFRFSKPAAVLYGAPVGAALIAGLSLALAVAKIPWNLGTVLLAIALVISGCVGVAWRLKNRVSQSLLTEINWSHVGLAVLGTAVFFGIQAVLILSVIGEPAAIPSRGDSVFHVQGVRIIAESGSASPLGPFPYLYGVIDGGASPNYPTLWHALGVLSLPFTPLVPLTNGLAIAVGLILWPFSLAAFAVSLAPKQPAVAFFAPAVVSGAVLFPAIEVFAFAVYPFVLSVVLLATSLGLLVFLIRDYSRYLLGAFAVATLGAISAQPTAGLVVLLALLVWGLVWILGAAGRSWSSGSRLRPFLIVLGVVVASALAVVGIPRLSLVRGLNQRPTESISYKDAVLNLLLGPTYLARFSLLMLALLALAFLGALLTLKVQGNLQMVITAAAILLLYFAAAGPDSYVRAFTTPWWKDASRFAIYLLIFVAGFAGVALGKALSWVGSRVNSEAVVPSAVGITVLALLAAFFALPEAVFSKAQSQEFVASSYERSEDTPVALNEDEVALLEDLDSVVDETTVIVGDPDSGVAWVSVFSVADQFQGLRISSNDEQAYLAAHFDEILDDPRVCEIINEAQINAFMVSDSPSKEFEGRNIGFNQTDTSVGFELLKEVGGARLYQITACD